MIPFFIVFQLCSSTQFGQPGDRYGGRTPALYLKRPVDAHDMGIAHRDWPMGTKIRVTNIRRAKTANGIVLDRGPYGKLDARGRWFNDSPGARKKRKKQRLGKWRGCADITPRLARAIRHNGRDMVLLFKLE